MRVTQILRLAGSYHKPVYTHQHNSRTPLGRKYILRFPPSPSPQVSQNFQIHRYIPVWPPIHMWGIMPTLVTKQTIGDNKYIKTLHGVVVWLHSLQVIDFPSLTPLRMVELLPKVKVDYYTAWIVRAQSQRVLGSLPWCLHEEAPALRMEAYITVSPAVTLHSLLSLSVGFQVLNILFPREHDLFLNLWISLSTLPSILGIAWLSGAQPHALQLLFLLCPGESLQFGVYSRMAI